MSNQMSILDHIIEFRKRIFIVIGCFVILFFGSYPITPYFIDLLKSTSQESGFELNIFKITESVLIYIKIMFILSFAITIPIMLIQLLLFIFPALNIRQKKLSYIFLPITSILFLVGNLLSLKFLSPLLLTFFEKASNQIGVNTVYSFMDYFNFIYTLCFISGLILELPAILIFLSLVGILTHQRLSKMRKFVYLFITIISVLITPPDFITPIILGIILVGVYEVTVLLTMSIQHTKSKKINSNHTISRKEI